MSRNQLGNMVAELGPVLTMIFFCLLLPLINLVGAAAACAGAVLLTNEVASETCTQQNFSDSLDAMYITAGRLATSGFARFCSLTPDGGFRGCGMDLFVQSTTLSGAVTQVGPNIPLSPPVDTSSNVYEYCVRGTFKIQPLVSLASVPMLDGIPGLGAPLVFRYQNKRLVEHPQGLTSGLSSTASSKGGAPPLFDRTRVGTTGPSYNFSQWRDPEIFQQIAAAGQIVEAVNVVQVPAYISKSSSGWVPTGLSIGPGQMVWLDTRADGLWNNAYVTTDANGRPGTINCDGNIDADVANNMLIGYVGTPPALPYAHKGMQISGDRRFIPSGNTLLNFKLPYSGPISLANNDNQWGDSGFQTVRIVITRH